jgi:hypothetical protein
VHAQVLGEAANAELLSDEYLLDRAVPLIIGLARCARACMQDTQCVSNTHKRCSCHLPGGLHGEIRMHEAGTAAAVTQSGEKGPQ